MLIPALRKIVRYRSVYKRFTMHYFLLTTHLLSNHDCESSQIGAAHAGNGKQFHEAASVVALAQDLALELQLGVNSVHVASALDVVVSELDHGLPSIVVTTFLHEPTGRLGTEVDQAEQWNGGEERSTCESNN